MCTGAFTHGPPANLIPDISERSMRLHTRDATLTLKQHPLYANPGEMSDNPTLKACLAARDEKSVLFQCFAEEMTRTISLA